MKKEILKDQLKEEHRTTGADILASLKPFFDEYFIGRVVLSEESLVYFLPNGQIFRINCNAMSL